MKKVFAIFAIAGVMVACNNSSEKKEGENKDTTAKMENTTVTPDTTTKMAPADTTAKPAADTTATKM